MAHVLSVVTVCMNRREHLLASSAAVARWPHHSEHLILDWSSRAPLQRDELPTDPRIRLVRVEAERQWHLCRAYNLALALAEGQCLLKLDADCWPIDLPHPDTLRVEDQLCAFGSGPDGRAGQWLMDRALLERTGGYNEYLQGYGFDDKDLRARVTAIAPQISTLLPASWIGVIPHSAVLRADDRAAQDGSAGRRPSSALELAQARAQKRATALANRILVARCPWGSESPRSRYEGGPASGALRVVPESIPSAGLEVEEEVLGLRRRVFWGLLLSVPGELVVQLPVSVLPADRRGRFELGRRHRWSWYLLRPLWAWPLLLLSALQDRRSRRAGGTPSGEVVCAALEAGDVENTLQALRLLSSARRKAVVDQVLFKRAFRPSAHESQARLLERLSEMRELPEHQRAYARVALGWWAVREGDRALAERLCSPLKKAATLLWRDRATLRCGRRNRENRLKRLVSTWTCLAHLQLMLEQVHPLPELSGSAHELWSRLEPTHIPADVLLRMSSNLSRCLVLQAPRHPEWLAHDLRTLLADLQQPRYATLQPQEDHRAYVGRLLDGLAHWCASGGGARPGVVPAFALAALNVDTPLVRRGLRRLWG